MQLSTAGRRFLANAEGEKLLPYLDAAKPPKWTVGVGIVISEAEAKRITAAGGLTPEESQRMFNAAVAPRVAAVQKYVKVPLSQVQVDALVSFVYNVGEDAFKTSTLLRKLNNKDYRGAAEEFLKWTRAGSAHPPGLVTRRKKERLMFLSSLPQVAPLTPPAPSPKDKP